MHIHPLALTYHIKSDIFHQSFVFEQKLYKHFAMENLERKMIKKMILLLLKSSFMEIIESPQDSLLGIKTFEEAFLSMKFNSSLELVLYLLFRNADFK